MGQQVNFTPKQQLIFDEIQKSDFIKQNFYFTGGTALSATYLNHRLSEDLDFFSEEKFDTLPLLTIMTEWGKKYNFKVESQELEVVRVFLLEFSDREKLKIDFGYYPYKRIKRGQFVGQVEVDSLVDIAVNKLVTIHQRSDVKDFVDLYFLLNEFTVWDLLEGVRKKFRIKLDPFNIGADFLKVEGFDYLPQMIKPLALDDLKSFFKQKAKEITSRSIE